MSALPSVTPGTGIGGAERPDEIDHVPALAFTETAAEGRHAACPDAVADQPEELTRVTARCGRRTKIGQRPRRLWAIARPGDAVAGGAMLAVGRHPRGGPRGVIRHERAAVRRGIGIDHEPREANAHTEGDECERAGGHRRAPAAHDE